jgi:Phosphotransferase enzyme family
VTRPDNSSSPGEARAARAMVAAVEVARGAGISIDEDPVLLPGVSNTVLGFPDVGLVAKVAAGRDAMGRLSREHSVAAELGALGAPVAAPLDGVEPTVHGPSDLVVTLWHWVDHDASAVAPARACAEALAALHEALDATTTPLPSFLVELGQARAALDDDEFMAELPSSERVFLRAAYDASLAQLEGSEYVSHRLHGEPHEANRLVTPDGVVWVDLESSCTGPREWDLAFLAEPQALDPAGSIDRFLLSCLRRLNHARLATWRWGHLRDYPDLRHPAQADLTFLKRT